MRQCLFLYNRKLRQCIPLQGEFAKANSLETCTPVHVFYTIGNCDSVHHCKENLRQQILWKRARRCTFLYNRKLRQCMSVSCGLPRVEDHKAFCISRFLRAVPDDFRFQPVFRGAGQ